MRHRSIGMFLVGLAAMVVAGEACAHPHVFIDDAMTVIFDDRDIVGLRMSWTFDEMYSSMIRTDYVRGKAATPAEVKTIEKENFLNLANYGFFLDLTVNGQAIKVKEVKDFDARFQGNKVVFEFTVPLRTAERRDPNVIEARVFDPEYYVEFAMRQADPLTIEHGEHFTTSCNVVRNEPKISALGPVNTDRAMCTYARKP